MSTGSAQQTSTTTAGLAPWSQPYVSSLLGAAQQQVFNVDPTTGQATGIKPYLAFGAPVDAQGNVVSYGAPAADTSIDAFKQSPAYQNYLTSQEGAMNTMDMYESPYFGLQGSGSAGRALDSAYEQWKASQPVTQTTAQPTVMGYPAGTMQAGMGPGEMMAARASVAGPSGLQQQAYQSAAGMQAPTQYGTATDIGQTAGLGLLNTAGQAQGLLSLAQQAVEQGRRYGQDIVNPYRTQQFMSPYMQNVVEAQQREALRRSAIEGTQQAGQAVKAGAFGGSRAGLLEAERQRNLATQLGDIQASGLQAAYKDAQAQQLAAQQQAMQGLTAGMQGYGQGIQGQTGAYGQAMQGAGTLSNIGGQQLGAQQSIANLQNVLGQQQQQNQQQVINQAMQNLQLQRMYPQQQLQYLSGMLSGMPVSSTGQVTNIPAPSLLSQAAGLGTSLIGGAGLYKSLTGNPLSSIFSAKGGLLKDAIKKQAPKGGAGIDSLGLYNAMKG